MNCQLMSDKETMDTRQIIQCSVTEKAITAPHNEIRWQLPVMPQSRVTKLTRALDAEQRYIDVGEQERQRRKAAE